MLVKTIYNSDNYKAQGYFTEHISETAFSTRGEASPPEPL
jgi:hypothetical protein